MIFFAHLGIGAKLASPWRRRLSLRWLLAGAITPDVLDKATFLLSNRGIHPPLIADPFFSGTRTVGHSIALVVACAGVSLLARSRLWISLAAGMATHIFLDSFTGLLGSETHTWKYVSGVLFWPLSGASFPVRLWTKDYGDFTTWLAHQSWQMWALEIVGIWLLTSAHVLKAGHPPHRV